MLLGAVREAQGGRRREAEVGEDVRGRRGDRARRTRARAELCDMRGKRVATGCAGTIVAGTTCEIGRYEVEIGEAVRAEDVDSGAAFSRGRRGGGAGRRWSSRTSGE